MVRKFSTICLMLATSALTLTGCAGSAINPSSESVTTLEEDNRVTNRTDADIPSIVENFEYELPNGERVYCIWAQDYKSGGLWCTPDFDVDR